MNPVKLFWYYLPNVQGEGYAMVVLGSNGFFATVSDFDNYAYKWDAFGLGRDFRDFFLGLNRDYLISKLDPRKELDVPATVIAIRQYCTEESCLGSYPLEELAGVDHESELDAWCSEYDDELGGNTFHFYVYREPHMIRRFVDEAVPRLKQMIREELEAEKSTLNPGSFWLRTSGPADRNLVVITDITTEEATFVHYVYCNGGGGLYCLSKPAFLAQFKMRDRG